MLRSDWRNSIQRIYQWKPQDEFAALSRPFAECLDRATVQGNQLEHERKPDPEPTARFSVGTSFLHEELENLRQHLLRYTDSIIDD